MQEGFFTNVVLRNFPANTIVALTQTASLKDLIAKGSCAFIKLYLWVLLAPLSLIGFLLEEEMESLG